MLKQISCALLSMMLIFTTIGSVNAVDLERNAVDLERNIDITQAVCVPLTEHQAEERYMELTGKELPSSLRGNYQVSEVYYREEIGPGWEIEIGCLMNVECGQSCSFVDVVDGTEYVAAVGDGFWDVDDQYIYITVEGSRKLRFRTRVQVEVETTSELAASYEIAGFSVSVSVSGTYYARKLMTVDSTKNF